MPIIILEYNCGHSKWSICIHPSLWNDCSAIKSEYGTSSCSSYSRNSRVGALQRKWWESGSTLPGMMSDCCIPAHMFSSWINFHFQAISKGIFVSLVQSGSPAALAGLRFGDQILQINGENVAGYSMDKVHSIFKKAGVNSIRVAVRDRYIYTEGENQ